MAGSDNSNVNTSAYLNIPDKEVSFKHLQDFFKRRLPTYTCLFDKEGISKSEELVDNTNCITSTYDYCYIAPKFFFTVPSIEKIII